MRVSIICLFVACCFFASTEGTGKGYLLGKLKEKISGVLAKFKRPGDGDEEKPAPMPMPLPKPGLEVFLPNLVGTAKALDLDKLVEAIVAAGLADVILSDDFTIFGPTSEANVVFTLTVEQMRSVLLAHVVKGKVLSSALRNGMMVQTANKDVKIRINVYQVRTKVITANCVPVISADNLASNGVIHVVPKLLLPISKSIFDIISSKSELSTLKAVLMKTGLDKVLDKPAGMFTLFAPNDDAFAKVDPDVLTALLLNNDCLTKVLLEHVVNRVLCSSAIQAKLKTQNLLKNHFIVKPNMDGSVSVQDSAKVLAVDKVGTNGVIHVIDSVLVPAQAVECLKNAAPAPAPTPAPTSSSDKKNEGKKVKKGKKRGSYKKRY